MNVSGLAVHDLRVATRDGTELATDVYVADDGSRRPALLVRSPYSRVALRVAHDPVGVARTGWAVVLQDVRGRADSGGTFRPFHQELSDGYDTVQWCAAQPWCDGRVAMMGASYNGATQWLAAAARPPALRAIAPSVIGMEFRNEFAYQGDAFELAGLSYWALALASTSSDPAIVVPATDLLLRWPDLLRSPDALELIAQVLPDFGRWSDPDERLYWEPINVSNVCEAIDLPAFHVAGWYDPFCEGAIRSFQRMSVRAPSEYARRGQRLVVGPWTHTSMYERIVGGIDFGVAAHAQGIGAPDDILRFLRSAIDGHAVESGASIFVMGANEWHHLTSWPPAHRDRRLFLDATNGANSSAGDGRLTWEPPTAAGVDSYRHDPADPVPNRGGRTLVPPFALSGPVNQGDIEVRTDVLVYTSDPFDAPVYVMGMVSAHLEVISSQPRIDVVATACVVEECGRSINILDGILRTAVIAGDVARLRVELGSIAVRIESGQRLRISIASSNFPRYSLMAPAEITLVRGWSHMELPVTEPTSRSDASHR